MKDWTAYSQATAANSNITGGKKPSVLEYACIRVVDNGSLVILVFLILAFAGTGLAINVWGTFSAANEVSGWFLDVAKLCLGVFLGVWSQRKKR